MSSLPAQGAPWEWTEQISAPAPYEYKFTGTDQVELYTSTCVYDGTGASADFVPALAIYSPTGGLLGRVFPQGVVAQGKKGSVTFVPPFGAAASAPAGSGAGIYFATSPQSGSYLDITTTGTDANGVGVAIIDTGGGGIELQAGEGELLIGGTAVGFQLSSVGPASINTLGDFYIFTNGGGFLVQNDSAEIHMVESTGEILLSSNGYGGINLTLTGTLTYLTIVGLPTTNPGGANRVWNDAGTLKIT